MSFREIAKTKPRVGRVDDSTPRVGRFHEATPRVGRFNETTPKVGSFDEKLSKEEADLGIPVKLLHEGEGHRVTVELKNGDICRGTLIESENNWTSQLESITYISKKMGQKRGQKRKASKLELVFIRGRRVRFIILPDMLKHASLFKLPNAKTKEEKEDDLMLALRLLHLTNYSQRMASEQNRYYL